jgi:hypothetical protein
MKKVLFLSLGFCLLTHLAFSQKNVNSYKYVVIPNQFNFQKSADSYQINSLTKFLFNKEGFTTFMSNEAFPEDLARNRCLGLNVVMNKGASMLRTKLNMQLVDCNNSVVFTTSEGQSREKEYKKAYHEAIRSAFVDIQNLNYKYNSDPAQIEESTVIVQKEKASVEEKVQKRIVTKTKPKTVTDNGTSNARKELPKATNKKAVPKEKVAVQEKKVPVQKKKTDKKVIKEKKQKKSEKIGSMKIDTKKGLEGTFEIDKWGECTIIKSGEQFDLIGGDEDFVFANIYKTSKSNLYIVKWVAYKEPQLLELNKQGNLVVDSENGTKVYKRLD